MPRVCVFKSTRNGAFIEIHQNFAVRLVSKKKIKNSEMSYAEEAQASVDQRGDDYRVTILKMPF